MLECARRGAGPDYEVTANKKIILARQEDKHGGRCDDKERVREIEDLLGTRVYLELWVKVRKKWRKDEKELRRLGYATPSQRG